MYNKCYVCGRSTKKPHRKCSVCRSKKRKKVSKGYKERIKRSYKRGY